MNRRHIIRTEVRYDRSASIRIHVDTKSGAAHGNRACHLQYSQIQYRHAGWIAIARRTTRYSAVRNQREVQTFVDCNAVVSLAKSKAAKLLAAADAFIESVTKGDATLYRARFAGLDKDRAEAACKFLKRNDVDCVTIRN